MPKDKSKASLPKHENIFIESLDRQVNVRRVRFGEKLQLLEFFSGLMATVTKKPNSKKRIVGGEVEETTAIDLGDFSTMLQNLPEAIGKLGKSYMIVFELATDLKEDEVEENLEPDDAAQIMMKIWKVNNFDQRLEKLGKMFGGQGKKGTPTGSKPSLPSSPPELAGPSKKS